MNRRLSLSFVFSIVFHLLLFGTVFLVGATNVIKSEPIFIMSLNSLQENQKAVNKKSSKDNSSKTLEKNVTEPNLQKVSNSTQAVNINNLVTSQISAVDISRQVNTGFSNNEKMDRGIKDGSPRESNNKIYSKTFDSSDGPKFIKRVIPEYPLREKRLGIEGKVVLELLIDENGRLISVRVLNSTNDDFAQAAINAVKQSTFRAAIENGAFVKSRAILPIRFVLED
ncbi:MAG TPA: energy transducer TonB [Thermodesulfobium narugense]|uniref:Protein TonB n=1 Tax=Thermodesulfobium acidiphilum TaxID=1794699 RepID=A0A2R4W208_THEAF|nr:energy transducer TonB [Thermodesulfobium acidiphilum]AWB10728.1 protein TonB [Thermodesulfobium acidiphilum]PMP85189.1 MAG: hypothetical protein C0174_05130 [Thermodesulfobium narugense]HEM55278.1 energy transducer TonB [Thermodesulfobium narugense]